jgi:hypothetical protein
VSAVFAGADRAVQPPTRLVKTPAANHAVRFAHLYAADQSRGIVLRFPLAADGLPAMEPDLILKGGLSEPYGLAVDRRGNLYVSDFQKDAVFEYPPGASGDARPIRQLSLAPHTPYYVGVDGLGYLFVGDLDTNAINVYRPGADRKEPPIHRIAVWEEADSVRNFLLDSAGRLYVLTFSPPVFVFNDPLHHWKHADALLQPQGGYEFGFNNAIAIDEPRNQIYINFGPQNLSLPYGKDDFAIRGLDASTSGGGNDRWILTKDCKGASGGQGNNPGAVISGAYLLFSCAEEFNAVLVYRAHEYGKQPLVEAVGSGSFDSVADIVLGP